ncbi:MAG TPA: hypothetical protein VHX88_03550 [Solirubrobacteraceae bacterium]|jgi:hypothetical protein|nr:hypothetical protein [Solirubrobacteraceae bacterium]
MFRPISRSTLAAVALTVPLALLPAAADAKAGSKSFAQTYPRANHLCTRTEAGNPPTKLAGETAQVDADCTALTNSFNSAVTAVQGAQSTYATGLQNALMAKDTACAPPATELACREAKITYRAAVRTLKANHRDAVRMYYISAEAGRRTFWAEIHGLRGGASITPDTPIQIETS